MNKFCERLKELRIEKHLTQKQLADAISTTDDTIFSWEHGRSQPNIENIIQLCCYFECSSDYLLGLESDSGEKIYINNSFNHFNNNGDFNIS